MATRYKEGDAPAPSAGPRDDDYDEVVELLVALTDQISRTERLIGRTGRLVEEIDQHRRAGAKFRRVPPR
jgi:hypothetical protein